MFSSFTVSPKARVSRKQKGGVVRQGEHGAHSECSFVFSVKCQGTGLGERYFRMFPGFAMWLS